MAEVNTGKTLKVIETDDINKIPFDGGQYIIVDTGMVYYDPTTGTSVENRVCLTPKQEVDVYTRDSGKTDEYYLGLQTKPINGDMVVIKDKIANTGKFTYSVYVYNNNDEDTNSEEWVKVTGSYVASNIYFDKEIVITTGLDENEYENGKKVIDAAGMSLTEVMDAIFSPEKNPIIEQPSVIIDFPQAGAYEIGASVTPSYEISLDPGNYQFGPDTNVKANSYKVLSSNGVTKSSKTGSFSTIKITESTNFYFDANISHSSGTIPVTIKGEPYTAGQIKAATITAESKHITGYVNGLYYGCSDTKVSQSDIDSDFIKDLYKLGKGHEECDVDFVVPVGTESIIIACPVDSNGINMIYNNTVNANMTEAFGSPFEVKVAGADGVITSSYARMYNVYIYSPAEAYENSASLTIKLI